MKPAAYLAGGATIAAAALVVPVPLVSIEPGVAVPVESRVAVEGPADEVNGDLLLTAVLVEEPSAVDAIVGWLDDDTDVLWRQAVIPQGVDEDEYARAQQDLFRESAEIAAAVGFRLAGQPVEIVGGGAQVAAVIEGGPADGRLREGDVIVAVNGRPARLASDVAKATARTRPGDDVAIDVRRGNEQRRYRIEVDEVSQLGRPGLGVALRTLDLDVRLPSRVRVDASRIGGPSAGLMLALTLYDVADPGDLARGRTIAGTGTIDLAGDVGVVGGVRQKVMAARRAGAELFLVPQEEAGEARDAAGGALHVVAVDTIDDALAALRGDSR